MAGPNLQADLLDIILRFRSHEVVLTADVSMMFRQITVDEEDRKLQCILWRETPSDPIKTNQLTTVTYGTTCAPYLAIRCLRQLAKEAKDELPAAAEVINKDCYMDDVLTGVKTVEEAAKLQKELSGLVKRGQFHLRKWRASDSGVLAHLNEECKSEQLLTLDGEGPLKTLGLLWDSSTDCLQYHVEPVKKHKYTKRNVLSKIAQVFDPLGLVGPVLMQGKIIMQQLWLRQLEWDQPLPPDLQAYWCEYYESLPKINELIIHRNINPRNKNEKIDIIGFSDASEKALGACLYALSENEEGKVSSHLICSKSKVAPVKTVSLPRLELMGALLLSDLVTVIRRAYDSKVGEIHLFTDSTITLQWIGAEPNTLKTFVANRVTKIQEQTSSAVWHHVPSASNPADILSRGIKTEEFINNQLWWHGPHWMSDKASWPTKPTPVDPDMSETKVVLTTSKETNIFLLTSSYPRLLRIVAFCLRIKYYAKLLQTNPEDVKVRAKNKKVSPISVEELQYAERMLARKVQQEVFKDEMSLVEKQQVLHKRSPLVGLNPFIDSERLLRVGGRLQHADLNMDRKHPIILPSSHPFTTLMLRHEHEKLKHCGAEQLLSIVRQRFWILSGRRAIRKITQSCINCFRCRPTVPQVIMGNLPEPRVKESVRPFTCTGIDYAGPIKLKESHRRGRVNTYKAYIAVFVCFNTKAVHIELVTSLTTECFLAALRRFTARRGICNQIFSDNGSNFIGAASELEELQGFLEKENSNIATELAKCKITWTFIPPRAPHCGGLWEAAVKVAKQRLNAVTQGLTLTYEECYTLLVEIEAVMNSRPLTPVSSDPSSLEVLTPAHFLINDSLIQPVQLDILETPDNRLNRWQLLQKVRQHFWRRWSLEYLQELQKRSKWTSGNDSLPIGSMVLLMEDNTSPLHWIRGRVVTLHPGDDGVTRKVTVKTPTGLLVRSIRRLCPLPIDEQFKNA